MSIYMDRAKKVRAITERHYNCAQSVLVAFHDVIGLDEEQAYRLGSHFGAGMKMGATCGAITGAMSVGLTSPSVLRGRPIFATIRAVRGEACARSIYCRNSGDSSM